LTCALIFIQYSVIQKLQDRLAFFDTRQSTFTTILHPIMPNLASAKKALRQSLKNASRNGHFKNLYKENEKAFKAALDKPEAPELYKKLQRSIDMLIKKNIVHPSNGARRKSRFAHMLKAAALKSK